MELEWLTGTALEDKAIAVKVADSRVPALVAMAERFEKDSYH